MRAGFSFLRAANLLKVHVSKIHLATGYEGFKRSRVEQIARRDGVEIAIDKDEVGVIARLEFAFVVFGELGVGGALRVGIECLAARDFLLWEKRLCAGFIHTGDGSVE